MSIYKREANNALEQFWTVQSDKSKRPTNTARTRSTSRPAGQEPEQTLPGGLFIPYFTDNNRRYKPTVALRLGATRNKSLTMVCY